MRLLITTDILFSASPIIYYFEWYRIWLQDPNPIINHLFYMDDLKLFAKDDNKLEEMLQLVKNFTADIGMTF